MDIRTESLTIGRGVQSLYSKQRNAGGVDSNESTLFNRIHKHSFEGLRADTLTCC
jgi:hypothetical protein